MRGKLPRQYAPVQMKETLKKKRIGYALRDDQILQLIFSEKDDVIDTVFSAGRLLVKKGKHVNRREIITNYK